ncbi:MAG: hypothetical protein ACRDCE_12925, partial [Cetobacterium sp.]|uniref:hypothetical protein n=1 Tax=Cetobacterium sp. TaxID=2071632 RepID=UPI003EE6D0AA
MDTYFITWLTGFTVFAVTFVAFLVLSMTSHVIYLKSQDLQLLCERNSESERAGKVFCHGAAYGGVSLILLCTAFSEYLAPWSQKPFLECFWFAGYVTYLIIVGCIALGIIAFLWARAAKLL